MIKAVLRLICVGAVVLSPAAASAQDFPSKPIRLIVPFPPGGPNDLIARVVGQKMSELLKQQVVIDNRGGAGGVARHRRGGEGRARWLHHRDHLSRRARDQHRAAGEAALRHAQAPQAGHVGGVGAGACWWRRRTFPPSNLAELVALARAKPGSLNYASSGPGSMPHLAGELLKVAAKVDIVHVPYKGAAPAVNDLVGQQVQMAFFDLPVLLPQVQAGKLKAIVVGSKQRAPSLKDVPTTAEAGFPQVEADNWYGMVAPVATPPAVVARLHQATVEALEDPGVREKLSSQGLNLIGNTPDEFTAYIRSEIEKWGKVAKAAKLVAN